MQASTHTGASHSNVFVFAFIVLSSCCSFLRQISLLNRPSSNYKFKAFLDAHTVARQRPGGKGAEYETEPILRSWIGI